MDKISTRLAVSFLAGTIVLVAALHYVTPVENPVLHQIYQRIYYIPIILAALRYGWRGGLGAATFAALSYMPHILLHWQHQNYEYALNQYAEIAMFLVIGAVTGWLGDQKRREHERAERINTELQDAYADLRQTVGQLLQAERLSSLAEVASGVVHEVRNPLGAIKGAVEIMEDEIPEDSPRREFARIAKIEVERIDKLVHEFLRFARPPKLSKVRTNLNDLVDSAIQLLDQQAGPAGVRVHRELVSDLPLVEIDTEQIMQVLLNLSINAVEAMPNGGLITFRTRPNGEAVLIEVEDTGGGIDPSIKDQIFDPFFTTKDKGSGLGLSIAHKIVTQHEGTIAATNTGSGTLFRVTLGKGNAVT